MKRFTQEGGRPAGAVAPRPSGARPVRKGLLAWLSRTFEALENRHFRWLWLGLVIAMGGLQMQMAVRGILAYDLTGDRVITGLVTLGFAPSMLLLALFGGVVGDRLERRMVVQGAQAGGALLSAAIGLLIFTDQISWVHLLIASFLQGGIFAFQMPARQAMIPRMVGTDKATNAVSLNAVGMSVMTMMGPAVGGLLYSFIGPDGAYFVMAALYGAAVFITGLVPGYYPDKTSSRKSAFGDILGGLSYIRTSPVIIAVLAFSVAVVLLSMPFRMLVQVFAKDVYGSGPDQVGVMIAVTGVGGLVGALGVAGLRRGHMRGMVLIGSAVVTGAVMLAVASVPFYVAGLAAMLGVGFGEAIRWALAQALVMEVSEDQYRARVMSVLMMSYGLMPLGVLPLSYAMNWFGPQQATGGVAVILLVVSALFVVFSPHLRRLS